MICRYSSSRTRWQYNETNGDRQIASRKKGKKEKSVTKTGVILVFLLLLDQRFFSFRSLLDDRFLKQYISDCKPKKFHITIVLEHINRTLMSSLFSSVSFSSHSLSGSFFSVLFFLLLLHILPILLNRH